MTKITIAISALAFLFASHASVACEYPAKVSIANGATATKEEMIASQAAVKKYVADMEAYLACIVDEEKAAVALMGDLEPEAEQQRTEMLDKKYNAAVEEMERMAAAFNAEVQTYKARDNS
ncbi:MAG: hypothetical protein L0Y45_01655 [Woeseiaceae bacterium]|nr:hypothetical protein [Woeseiaceae bacterium]